MAGTQAGELIKRINLDMRQAMKNRKQVELNELRSLLARISNAEAVALPVGEVVADGPIAGAVDGVGSTDALRKQLTLAEVQSIILAEINDIKTALVGLDEASAYAGELREKAAVVRRYAP